MLHARISASDASPAGDATISVLLSQITQGIDARFVTVGKTLAQAVESIDGIVTALREATSTFEAGEGAAAVSNLTTAARRLSGVGHQMQGRAQEMGEIQQASRRLSAHIAEVKKSLHVLHIFGLNVKIAASGADTFVDFANTMSGQLAAGEAEVGALQAKLEGLATSLRSMEHNDRLLASECQRVVPHVPDRLEADAAALRKHQAMLSELAEKNAVLARSIQGSVANVLGAIQVGDIARQRLEHVLQGYADMQATLATAGLCAEDEAATRDHLLRLLLAQLTSSAQEFRTETQALVRALRGMVPEADRLIALSKGGGSEDGQVFLRSLEAGIAEASAMIAQLQLADAQAAETLRIIVDTVDDLTGRAAAMRILRIEVQQMAINIGLKCRRVEAIGRPVAVIANEIRASSDSLDQTIKQITAESAGLGAISLRMRKHADAHVGQDSDGLASSLSAIREGALRTEQAMAVSERMASGLLGALRSTTDELEQSLDLGDALERIEDLLTIELGRDVPLALEGRDDQIIRAVMERMARSYTMASERMVHEAFLLPGMARLIADKPISSASPGGSADDDDALFDDALF
ncbi:MAG: hypothetical protein Q27BB25_16910 [Blastomonas sp. CACIA14H2]|uniref:hypothetical protein n=1 Tax=unclassified Blastomonas TaxID=2626550 RepID=UPI0003CFBF3B|nr:MAG: hypothetical protein Q27BB25_16910 [Blastomonas sp. CACIA14H2]